MSCVSVQEATANGVQMWWYDTVAFIIVGSVTYTRMHDTCHACAVSVVDRLT